MANASASKNTIAGVPCVDSELIVRCSDFSPLAYEPVWKAMQAFTASRNNHTRDEVWLLCHQSVFTQGQAGKPEHIVDPGDIPVVQIDRGGQVTYHGPGQLVAYILVDVRRRAVGVRDLVESIENTIIDVLAEFDIDAQSDRKAPGVYVKGAKIAALGLRIRQGSSYHGLSLNVAMDLAPFERINPCGYQGMRVTQLSDLATLALRGPSLIADVASRLSAALGCRLGYSKIIQAEADFLGDTNSE